MSALEISRRATLALDRSVGQLALERMACLGFGEPSRGVVQVIETGDGEHPGGFEIVIFNSGFDIEAGLTVYLLPFGFVSDLGGSEIDKASTPMPDGNAVELHCESVVAPGAGETFVYAILKDGSLTGLTVTISGSETKDSATVVVPFVAGEALALRLIVSAGAAETRHKASLRFVAD